MWLTNRSTWVAIGGLVLALWAYYAVADYGTDRYQAGWDAAVAQTVEQARQADVDAAREAADRLAAALAQRTRELQDAQQIAQDLLNRPPVVIPHEITTDPCERMGPALRRLYNDTIGPSPDLPRSGEGRRQGRGGSGRPGPGPIPRAVPISF